MAGKKDVVEQALKLVVGGSEDVAKQIAGIRKSDPFPVDYIEPGSLRYRYEHPDTSSFMEIITRPKGARSASVIGLEVPEEYRGTGIGKALQERVLQDFPSLMGQVSSKAAAVNAYKAGRRPIGNPNATLEDVFRIIDEDSSVNLATEKSSGGSAREGYQTKGRVVGDVVEQALKLVAGTGPELTAGGIRAYHGSPHYVDRFDVSKIGTGEGNQSFGHGLYFAGKEDIAKYYRDRLSRQMFYKDQPVTDFNPDESPQNAAINAVALDILAGVEPEVAIQNHSIRRLERAAKYREGAELSPSLAEKHLHRAKQLEDVAKAASQLDPSMFSKNPGHMYEVEIEADPNRLIDWNDPLKEQAADVRSAIMPFAEERASRMNKTRRELLDRGVDMMGRPFKPERLQKLQEVADPETFTGENIYRQIQAQLGASNQGDKAEEASQFLTEKGLHGIQYLDASSRGAGIIEPTKNFVIPEDKRINIIRRYAEGGEVNETDGRDEYAGGGKAVKEALRIAAEGLEALSKDKGQTPEQLLKGFANQKPRVPYEEWRYEFEPTAELLPSKEFNPENLKPGDVIIPLVGDRTSTGRKITSIAGTPLETPAITEGGPDYMRGPAQQEDKSVWASGKGVITGLEGRIDRALKASEAKGYKDPEVYGSYVAMSPQSGDFSTHTAEAIMGMLPSAKIKRADVKEFDTVMRERFPDWPGLMSPKAADYVVNANAGEHRKAFIEAMDSAYWRDRGMPDASLARYATTTPELIASPTEAAGYNIARITPSNKPEVITQVHRSYPSTMHGEYVGGLPPGMTRDELFTQFSRNFDADPPARNYVMAKRRSFGMDPNAFQVMEGSDIEDLIKKVESIKRGYADGGEVYEDDDIEDALRVAKDVGGATSSPVMMEDAKGNKYDAQGNIIPPTAPGPNPQRTPTPQEVGQRAAQDPATFDAMMERYAVPDRDIADYKSTRAAVQQQPQQIQQMTHVGAKPRREMTINMPMFGGEYSMGTAPYDVASGLQGMAQGAYDFKTAPAYFFPPTAPFAFGADLLESRMADDPVGLALNLALTPQGASAAKSAGRTVMDVFRQNPKTIGAATGAGAATIASDEAEAGPARWFSKVVEAARAIPMNKMTGEQALAMLRKGTSPEELRWMGAEDFLSGQKQVSKDDLVAFLEKNRVQPKEIVLGGGLKPTRREDVRPDSDIVAKYVDMRDKAYKEYRELNQQIKQAADAEQWGRVENLKLLASEKYREYNGLTERMIDDQIERMGGLARAPKYRDYSTPGGEGYQETLTVFGNQQMPNVVRQGKSWTLRDADNNPVLNRAGEPYFYYDKSEADRAAKAIYREGGSYKSSHWDDPNVLFHTRSQVLDVTPPGANRPYKAWNVDETQSDWGQAARKYGMLDPKNDWRQKYMDFAEKTTQTWVENKAKNAFDAAPHFYDNNFEKAKEWANKEAYRIGASRMASDLGVGRELDDLYLKMSKQDSAVESAPYVSSTEGWTDRAIKGQLDKALDAGSDYFTWSPGDVHAKRYSLDKFIDRVTYNPNTGDFSAYDKEGNVVLDEAIIDEELENYVGKEVADKILEKINELPVDEDTMKYRGSVKLNNLDLKTGGEGMRGYYDKVYLKRVQEVIRKATGEKPVIETIEVQTANGPREQLGIRLTDEMREKARFSDFKKGGRVTGGNAYDSNHTVENALALTREY